MFKFLKNLFSTPVPEFVEPVEEKPVFKASMPRNRVVGYFVPLEDFEGYTPQKELLGYYKQGRTYYLRAGNTMLADLAKQWKTDGLVAIFGD